MLRPISATHQICSPLRFSLHRYIITSSLLYFAPASPRNSVFPASLRYLFSFDFQLSTVNSILISPQDSRVCSPPQSASPPACPPRAPPPPDQPAPSPQPPPRSSQPAQPASRARAHSPAPQSQPHLPSPAPH